MHDNPPCVPWFAFCYHLLSPTSAQPPALDPSTTIDIFCLYFLAVGWSDTYHIPLSSFVLSNVQVYRAEFTMTIDFIEPDQRPLIFTSRRTPIYRYLPCIFIKRMHCKPSISVSSLYTVGSYDNSSLTRPLSYLYTIIFNQILTRNHYFLFIIVPSSLC